MKWTGVTRYEGQFTYKVLPHDFYLLTSGQRHINWAGIGYEGNDDVVVEIHPWDPADDEVADSPYWVGGTGEGKVGCATFASAVSHACDYFVPGFSRHTSAVDEVMTALTEAGVDAEAQPWAHACDGCCTRPPPRRWAMLPPGRAGRATGKSSVPPLDTWDF